MQMNPVLTIALPLILAFTKIMYRRIANLFLVLGSLLNVLVVFFIKEGQYLMGGYAPPFGIVLQVDAYALYSLLVLNVLFAALTILVTKKAENLTSSSLIALAALNGLILTGDLFNLFVFLEIAAIAAIIIASSSKRYHHAFHYMVASIIGSTFYLLGLILLYKQYGTLNMAKMHELMLASPGGSSVAVILIFVGLAVEVKLMPFSGWVKGVLKNADEWIGPMIGAIYGGAMMIVMGRLFTDVFVVSPKVTLLLSILALVTLVGGEAAAYDSEKMREILLYSGVAQSGLEILLILNGYAALSFILILSNMMAKYVMFLLSGYIVNAAGTDVLGDLKGLFRSNPFLGFSFTAAGLSLAGLPLFVGFFIKLNILYNLMMSHSYWLPAIILITSLVEGIYMLRMILGLWQTGLEVQETGIQIISPSNIKTKYAVHAITLILSLAMVVFGLMPDYALDLAQKARGNAVADKPAMMIGMKGGPGQ